MERKVLLLLLMATITIADAETLIFEDSTHLHKLLCHTNTSSIILRDLNFIDSNNPVERYYAFNNGTLMNVIICYEIGNTYDVNVGNWAFSNLNTIAIVGFIAVIAIIIIIIVLKRSKRKPR